MRFRAASKNKSSEPCTQGSALMMWPDVVSITSKRAGERVATNNRRPLSSRAMGKLLSNAIRHREIAPVFRLITATCFRSGTFT